MHVYSHIHKQQTKKHHSRENIPRHNGISWPRRWTADSPSSSLAFYVHGANPRGGRHVVVGADACMPVHAASDPPPRLLGTVCVCPADALCLPRRVWEVHGQQNPAIAPPLSVIGSAYLVEAQFRHTSQITEPVATRTYSTQQGGHRSNASTSVCEH